MTTTKTATTHAPAHPRKDAQDAIALLRSDHAEVMRRFADVEKTHSNPEKKAIVAEICAALTVHAQIEEEIFYPAVRAALKDPAIVAEAMVEHAGAKDLIAQLEGVQPDGEMYDAKVKVLSEYVKHHVKEEQDEMFAKARKASALDLVELGAKLAARKDELMAKAR